MRAKLTVLRFDPTRDAAPYEQTYTYALEGVMSALNALEQIRSEQDPTLSFSACCKAGHCGICGAMVNGRPALLCRATAVDGMRIAPLSGLPVKKDLVVDRDGYERRRDALLLFLERRQPPAIEPEPIAPAAFARFRAPSRCIECYCCLSVCPVFQKNPGAFAGPCALVLLARHSCDPRDELDRKLLANGEGVQRCTECGACTGVCPADADPAASIKALKGYLL